MTFEFKKATKESARLRMALAGISGSGKTYTALAIATGLGGKIALIDTERGSAKKYADLFDFDTLDLDDHSPESYMGAIRAAEAAGFDTLIIDSLSHEWAGRGGILELHERHTQADAKKDSFRAWGKATPKHNQVIDVILSAKMHIIATMRSKSEYAIDVDDRGKKTISKVGLAPVQRADTEYEFDIVGNLNLANDLAIEKTRCPALKDKVFACAGQEVADILSNWLSVDGKPPVDPPAKRTPIPKLTVSKMWSKDKQQLIRLLNELADAEFSLEDVSVCLPAGVAAFGDLDDDNREEVIERLSIMLDSKDSPA